MDPGVYERILAGLREYLARHGLDDINAIVGSLDFPGAPPVTRDETRGASG